MEFHFYCCTSLNQNNFVIVLRKANSGNEHNISDVLYFIIKTFFPYSLGYVWTLVFSTSQHGFSLNSMYRKMNRLESPILMVIQDTENNVS